MIVVQDLEQTFRNGNRSLTVLQDINLTVLAAEFVAVIGPSGSGKTTLL